MLEIRQVRTAEEAAAVRVLALEFVDWLRERYPEMAGEIDSYLEQQKFHQQIEDVRPYYNPPKGECLLALKDGDALGILMLKAWEGEVCEMNRMFVRESARGLGVGRALVEHLKGHARTMGFRTMILSLLPRHREARPLYLSAGFRPDERYRRPGNSAQAEIMSLDLTA